MDTKILDPVDSRHSESEDDSEDDSDYEDYEDDYRHRDRRMKCRGCRNQIDCNLDCCRSSRRETCFEDLSKKKKSEKKCDHDQDKIDQIKIFYLIAIILWVIIILWLQLYKTDLVGWIFLLLPVAVYFVNFSNLDQCTKEVEENMFDGNFLSFAFLISVILINWNKTANKGKYFRLLTISLVMIMLSLVDLWVSKKSLILTKHIRSIFQTTALFLLAYTLYTYYKDFC